MVSGKDNVEYGTYIAFFICRQNTFRVLGRCPVNIYPFYLLA